MDFTEAHGAAHKLMKNEDSPFATNNFDGFGYATSFFVMHINIILYFMILLYLMKYGYYDSFVVERK